MSTPLRRDPVQFTQESARRIARVVRGVETLVAPTSPLTFAPYFATKKNGVVMGTFTGAWPKSTAVSKAVTFLDVDPPNNTAAAYNVFANITASTAARHCAIMKYKATWYLIQAEC